MKQTAVEWFYEEIWKQFGFSCSSNILEKDKEMEKQMLCDLVDELKNYTSESNNILGHDEREPIEFVEIFLNKR